MDIKEKTFLDIRNEKRVVCRLNFTEFINNKAKYYCQKKTSDDIAWSNNGLCQVKFNDQVRNKSPMIMSNYLSETYLFNVQPKSCCYLVLRHKTYWKLSLNRSPQYIKYENISFYWVINNLFWLKNINKICHQLNHFYFENRTLNANWIPIPSTNLPYL